MKKGDWKVTRAQRRHNMVLWLMGVRFISIEHVIKTSMTEREK